MLYPITIFLWALFAYGAPNQPTDCKLFQTPVSGVSSTQTPPLADSSFLKELSLNLHTKREATAAEKLYLHLDRTLLKPGETIWFNAYLRSAGDLLPSLQSQILYVDLLDTRGSVLQSKKCLALEGIAAGEFDFPATLPGGLYKIKAYTNWMLNFHEAFERDITLQNVVLPRVNLKLEFERKGIGAGETAIARFDAQSLDNKAITDRKLTVTAALAGQTFYTGEAKTDANGRAYIRFPIPDKLESADGLLNIQLENAGQMEAISRPIPIVLHKIDLQFFPEGGNAVTGLPTRMAFKAVDAFGKPADVEGTIHDSQGVQVATFSSFHDGMGAFEFLPKSGPYEARLTKPFVSEKAFPLPTQIADGFVLTLESRTEKGLTFQVAGTQDSKLYLAGQSQDKIFFFKELNSADKKGTLVEVPTQNLLMGIARFTLFDQNKVELAERLVFVNQDKGLKINIKTDKEKYLPRERVKLNIQVTDQQDKPVQGKFSLGVTDETLLTFADNKQGNILASLLLEQDVKGKIEEPNFYFDAKEPKAGQALDYLLMTQGWRRFEWKQVWSPDPPAITYGAERAEINGTLYQKNNKPAGKIKIQLYPNGPTTLTDQNGWFSFQNITQDGYTHLCVKGKEYYWIDGFGSYLMQPNKDAASPAATVQRMYSPGGATMLTGTLKEAGVEEVLIGASIIVSRGGRVVQGIMTNIDGKFQTTLEPGVYDLEFRYTGFQSLQINGVRVEPGKINYLNALMGASPPMTEVVISNRKVAPMARDKTAHAQTLSPDQIRNLPTRNVNAIIGTTAGATALDGGEINIKGSRANDTNYYVDGIRVTGAAQRVYDPAVEECIVVAFKQPLIRADEMSSTTQFSSALLVPRSSTSGKARGRQEPHIRYYGRSSAQQINRSRVFYAPQYSSNEATVNRTDFRPTIYWNPTVQTNKKGEAQVAFFTSDAITNFRATLEGISVEGAPGHCEKQFFAQKPFEIALKVPPSVITGDVLKLQIVLTNNTTYTAGGSLSLSVPPHFQPTSTLFPKGLENISVGAGETKILEVPYKIGQQTLEGDGISLQLSADEIVLDGFETSIKTINPGYPAQQVAGGTGANTTFNIHLNHPINGTVLATLTAYPNPLADLLKGMERMLQQPSGCFEQVSSSNYPNLLVLDLLRQTGKAEPAVEARAMSLLEDGYKKLIAYECKTGGFDWFGRDPGHEGLTAYGILEFTDMAKVFPVDKDMIARTVKWLYKRRDGNGGWTLNPNSLHSWVNDPVLDCYIVWALAEAGYGQEFMPEIAQARTQAIKSNDPYQLALLANAMLAMGDSSGKNLLEILKAMQEEKGSWMGTTHTAMQGSGECMRIETTALTALALMKAGQKGATLNKAIDFLVKAKTGYGYGSTQSTVMALKAIIAYVKFDAKSEGDGYFSVLVDGKKTGDYAFSTASINKLEVPNLEQYFTSDHPTVQVVFKDAKVTVPYDLEVKYASKLPQDAPNCPISLNTALAETSASIGQTVRLKATVKNNSDKVQASPMVVVGIPSGASLQAWQLKKLVEEKKCDFYELWDGFAVFHFDQLLPNESRELNLDLRAEFSGEFEAPASQAFLYYTNDQRVWSKPEKLIIL